MQLAAKQADWVPSWVFDAIIYHIYPLGYLNAPPYNPLNNQVVPRLAELSNWYDYWEDLGISTIYLGPIFQSHSHGYDVIDYFEVDQRLGTLDSIKQLVEALHQRDMHVIMEGVFNHTGRGHFAFQDVLANRQDSEYAHWYHIDWDGNNGHNDGFSYISWEGHERLPKLNHSAHEVREHLYDVAKYWMNELDIDGWRLDVAYEIGAEFWWHFRRVCKHINADCFLLGEMFSGNYRDLVNADHLDSATNYHLYNAFTSAFNNDNLWELKSALDRLFGPEYGIFQDLPLINFMGNHDVTRILDLLNNDIHLYPAMITLMTIPGVPALYYGDEAGMRGFKYEGDEALRRPMPAIDDVWPDEQRDIFRELSRLTAIRKANVALTRGSYAGLQTTHEVFSYLRYTAEQHALIALNSSGNIMSASLPVSRYNIPDGTQYIDVLNDDEPFTVENGRVYIPTLWPAWGRILISRG